MGIKINCDMGESFGIWKMGLDEEFMKYIDMANIACGFHASDPLIMDATVKLAKRHNVILGAHPSYDDLKGFGRRSIPCSFEEIKAIVIYQISAMAGFCKANDIKLEYVKPHGALYNDMMKDENIFKAILEALSSFDKNIKLMILSSSKNENYESTASLSGISLLYEVFADRNYNDDGTLVARTHKDAVIHDEQELIKRVENLKDKGFLNTITGKELFLKTDTICVHGDNEKALEFIKILKKAL